VVQTSFLFFKKILASCLQINIFIAVNIYAKISQPISAGVRGCAPDYLLLATGYLLLASRPAASSKQMLFWLVKQNLSFICLFPACAKNAQGRGSNSTNH